MELFLQSVISVLSGVKRCLHMSISSGEVPKYLPCLKEGKVASRVSLDAKSYFLQLEKDFVLQSGWRLLESHNLHRVGRSPESWGSKNTSIELPARHSPHWDVWHGVFVNLHSSSETTAGGDPVSATHSAWQVSFRDNSNKAPETDTWEPAFP